MSVYMCSFVHVGIFVCIYAAESGIQWQVNGRDLHQRWYSFYYLYRHLKSYIDRGVKFFDKKEKPIHGCMELVYVYETFKECRFFVWPCFSRSGLHVLFVFLGWIVRWGISGQLFFFFNLVRFPWFYQNSTIFSCVVSTELIYWILLASIWCINAVVLTQPQLERNLI